MTERKARIFNIQKYNVYDGPGIRTLVFFQGCPLRCKWCANPEGLVRTPQVMFKKDVCVNCGRCVEVCPQKIHVFSQQELRHMVDRAVKCTGCRKCLDVCPTHALEIAGEEKRVSELLEIIREDRMFYDISGGGVTLGGGEVMAQAEAAVSLLQACKQEGISTAVETCGYAMEETVRSMMEFVDLFLFDIKQIDTFQHNQWTGVHNERILENLTLLLRSGNNVRIRMPLFRGVNVAPEDIAGVIDFLYPYKACPNLKGVDLLPYHKMGVQKYRQLDMEYPIRDDPSLSEEDLSRIETQFRQAGLPVNIVRH